MAGVSVSTPWLLAADARIDNASDLQRLAGPSSSGASGAHILLTAWAKRGPALLQDIVGDFALAVYDQVRRTLTLARDPTGQRPLFYKIQGSAIAFASLPSGLRRVFFDSETRIALLARNLENVPGDAGKSYFGGIEKVEPGEVIEFRGGTITRWLYWNPQVVSIPRDRGEDYVETYRSLLDAAVACRIDSARPIASQLSSGLDSSAVTATAAALIEPKSDLVALTAAPHPEFNEEPIRHRFGDESVLAAETARMHGIRHVIIRDTPPLFDVARIEASYLEGPVLDPFNMAWWTQVRREARKLGARTLLTGEIGNLTLNAGSLQMLSALIQRGSWAQWLRQALSLGAQSNVNWRGILVNSFGHWLPHPVRDRLQQVFLGVPTAEQQSFVRPEWREQLVTKTPAPEADNPYQSLRDAIRRTDFGLQRKAALASHGIEELDPLSDRRILDFSLRVPPEVLLRDGRTRALARTALEDRVPTAVLDLQTRGLQSADWHIRISQQEARDVFESVSANAQVQDLLNLDKMDRAIQDWPTTDLNGFANSMLYRNQLVTALSVGIFLSESQNGI